MSTFRRRLQVSVKSLLLDPHTLSLVLDQIMMGEGDCEAAVAAIHAYLEGISLQIRRGGEIPLEKFIISKVPFLLIILNL